MLARQDPDTQNEQEQVEQENNEGHANEDPEVFEKEPARTSFLPEEEVEVLLREQHEQFVADLALQQQELCHES
ncbi:hypothetical protein KEM55_003567 [Ascosphaera atra]|nr:hypothetical protein KEM55_003567 [Ascosphaera atra]